MSDLFRLANYETLQKFIASIMASAENVVLNFNVGVLGHVDSGKTSLAKALSTVASTACFDKNPQSKERGITLDLGFSSFSVALPPHLRSTADSDDALVQFTLVDCPGHASLIRTVIGGCFEFIYICRRMLKINPRTQFLSCVHRCLSKWLQCHSCAQPLFMT